MNVPETRAEMCARHRKASKARSTEFQYDWIPNIPGIDGDHKLFRELFRLNYYGGLAENAFAMRLFDPAVKDLRELPLGLLEAKEEALPPSRVPQSLPQLERLLRGFINRNDDTALIETMAAGLPSAPDERRAPLGAFARRMWDLAQKDDVLFRGLL